jgi:23S rRNA (cytosine1962-C5)-methyltransferase
MVQRHRKGTRMSEIVLKPGRERSILKRHPWIFSGAIDKSADVDDDIVEVYASDGTWLARALWSPYSQIRARVMTWQFDEPIDMLFFRRRIAQALAMRMSHPAYNDANAMRIVHGESDLLPGLIIDRYGDYISVQLLSRGIDARRDDIVSVIVDILKPRGIIERSDGDMRQLEGLPNNDGVLWGEAPPLSLTITHPTGLRETLDLDSGQKTGGYLDQALNRVALAAYANDADVLDCFCYNGGFSVAMALGGARSITAVDASGPALVALQHDMQLNGATSTPLEVVEADVFKLLRHYRDEDRLFDVIILDPPKFAHSQAQVDRATRGYKDINLLAMKLLRPGGLLATYSCSGLVSADLFQKVIFGAAIDAHRDVQIIERHTQAPDHPVLLSFPEGEYLKGLVCRVW